MKHQICPSHNPPDAVQAKYEKQINTKKKKQNSHIKRCNRCQITQFKLQMSPKTGGRLLVRVEDATVFRTTWT